MKSKPNILFILSDDHGHWGMGCAGNKELRTPNLDRLAKQGTRFNNAFCASPVCSPARFSIFTGKIPSQHGIHDWLSKGHIDEEVLSKEVREQFCNPNASWEYQWPKLQLYNDKAVKFLDKHLTFTEILANNGYNCGLTGKWHMGDSYTPQAGFTFWKTVAMGAENYYYPIVLENNEMVMKHEYVTDIITNNALEFLNEQRSSPSPFYLSVHYTAPHAPWEKEQNPEEFYKLYEDCPFESVPNVPAHAWGPNKDYTEKEWQAIRRANLQGYYSAISAMDASIGTLLNTLQANAQLDNTIIIFTSDNGMSMGHHGIFGKGNGTFPMNMYDSAVKVPMIIRHPLHAFKGQRCDELISHYDLFPTILDWTGIGSSPDNSLVGKSFVPLLTGDKTDTNSPIVVFDEYGPVRMIRTKTWKYIHRYPYGPHELYNLMIDPNEENNLIDDPEFEQTRLELYAQLYNWYLTYADPSVDGKGEAVTGRGQRCLMSEAVLGKQVFEKKDAQN